MLSIVIIVSKHAFHFTFLLVSIIITLSMRKRSYMKKFLLVVLIVLVAIGVLAACSQIETIEDGINDVSSQITDRAIPTWVIIIGAVVLFFIALGIVWKLIPGFIKFVVLIVIAAAIAGAAYGLWTIPAYDKAEEITNELIDDIQTDEAQ